MQENFHVRSIRNSPTELTAALYLQVSIISQALIFVTRSRSWSFVERPGLMLVGAFFAAQLVRILKNELLDLVFNVLFYRKQPLYLLEGRGKVYVHPPTLHYGITVGLLLLVFNMWLPEIHNFLPFFPGCYRARCICKLGICQDQGSWLGMGSSYLDLHNYYLYPS